jgi:hypothetical protein
MRQIHQFFYLFLPLSICPREFCKMSEPEQLPGL